MSNKLNFSNLTANQKQLLIYGFSEEFDNVNKLIYSAEFKRELNNMQNEQKDLFLIQLLTYCMRKENAELVNKIIDHGLDVSVDGEILNLALKNGDKDIVANILQRGGKLTGNFGVQEELKMNNIEYLIRNKEIGSGEKEEIFNMLIKREQEQSAAGAKIYSNEDFQLAAMVNKLADMGCKFLEPFIDADFIREKQTESKAFKAYPLIGECEEIEIDGIPFYLQTGADQANVKDAMEKYSKSKSPSLDLIDHKRKSLIERYILRINIAKSRERLSSLGFFHSYSSGLTTHGMWYGDNIFIPNFKRKNLFNRVFNHETMHSFFDEKINGYQEDLLYASFQEISKNIENEAKKLKSTDMDFELKFKTLIFAKSIVEHTAKYHMSKATKERVANIGELITYAGQHPDRKAYLEQIAKPAFEFFKAHLEPQLRRTPIKEDNNTKIRELQTIISGCSYYSEKLKCNLHKVNDEHIKETNEQLIKELDKKVLEASEKLKTTRKLSAIELEKKMLNSGINKKENEIL